MRVCSVCKIEKPLVLFHRRARGPEGYNNRCRPCQLEAVRKREQGRKLRGIEESHFEELSRIQDGRCWICQHKEPLVIDHNHSNGKVRGLLCSECNSGLGLFYDSESFLKRAIEYVTRTPDMDLDYVTKMRLWKIPVPD